ncbi:MAG: pantoate--beta-alanine ligase [Candidatus Cloacimonadota bacterium]|jgi:pantoate--beta-alanine ligase|nr:pantoate--beta-alanine ligase [Candidatus Cloacimonadota bacterium]
MTKVLNTVAEMKEITRKYKGQVGFVPTMGYLHQGHLSLVEAAKKNCDTTVVSIFVNPTQFAPNEDLETYPRNFERDLKFLEELQVDYVFYPTATEIYPKGYKTWVQVEEITQILCGASRPTHFKGVTTIICKLINIVKPDKMFMGEKDFQQLIVLQQMTRDLNFDVEVVGCPIVREADGLAMSSRNEYLSDQDRKRAVCLFQSLQRAQELAQNGQRDVEAIKTAMRRIIENNNGEIDYIEIVDSQTLQKKEKIDKNCRALVAVKYGKTRLIDNLKIC